MKISTEIVQLITSNEANNYRLVPYEVTSHNISFYGDTSTDYVDTKRELGVVFGKKITVNHLPDTDFQKLLIENYRTTTTQINIDKNFLNELIQEAFISKSSDIHFESYEERCRVRFRIDGKLIERYVIDKNNYVSLVNQIKILSNLDISEKRLPQDGRILFNKNENRFDVRVSCLPTIHGEKIVLRLLTRSVELLDIDNLGLDEKQLSDYKECVAKPYGMILITGPTGSGKSTTLYATLRLLNNVNSNILTIEDPVEYTLEGVNQVQLKEEIGLTFGSTLRSFLRQDPDIIMLGEIRDSDTAHMAIRSALTGHLIFSTIHTNTAWGSVSRLTDMGVHPYLTSGTLIMCVAQRLVRLLCPHCKEKKGDYYSAVGCGECYHTGYKGRRAIYEVIKVDEHLKDCIRQGDDKVNEYLLKQGVTTLSDSAKQLLDNGLTTIDEILPLL